MGAFQINWALMIYNSRYPMLIKWANVSEIKVVGWVGFIKLDFFVFMADPFLPLWELFK